MFNFLAGQIPGPIFYTHASLGHASVTGMSIGNLQKILLHDIHNLLCDLILKHESTSPEFVWGFQCSLLGSKIHYLGQEKSNSLHGSTQVVNIHYLGQNRNAGEIYKKDFVYKGKNHHISVEQMVCKRVQAKKQDALKVRNPGKEIFTTSRSKLDNISEVS